MSDHVGVHHRELVAHSGSVAAIGDRVGEAARAGSAVRPGLDAYGKLCAMVPVMLGALQDVLVEGVTTAAGSLHDTATRLRTTAEGYVDTDRRRAGEFDRIRSNEVDRFQDGQSGRLQDGQFDRDLGGGR